MAFDLASAMPNSARAEPRVRGAVGDGGAAAADASSRAIEVLAVNLRGVAGPATRAALVAPSRQLNPANHGVD